MTDKAEQYTVKLPSWYGEVRATRQLPYGKGRGLMQCGTGDGRLHVALYADPVDAEVAIPQNGTPTLEAVEIDTLEKLVTFLEQLQRGKYATVAFVRDGRLDAYGISKVLLAASVALEKEGP